MNINESINNNFETNLQEIKIDIQETHESIKNENLSTKNCEPNFIKFKKSLEGIRELIHQEIKYENLGQRKYFIAKRIVQFYELEAKIRIISKSILKPMELCFSLSTIKFDLTLKINRLRLDLEKLGRLPFLKQRVRHKYFQDVKKSLSLPEANNLEKAENDTFHLLGNSLNLEKSDIQDVDNGSYSIYSLVSWKKVISNLIEEKNLSPPSIWMKLLPILNEAKPIVLKISYLGECAGNINDQPTRAYYEDMIQLCGEDQISNPTSLRSKIFLQKYKLENNCSIPFHVLSNEITWDILESIQTLKKGEKRLFLLGPKEHTVAIEVMCLKPASHTSCKGNYRYKIINTGVGVNFHKTKIYERDEIAQPLLFENLPLSAFSYDFISDLVKSKLNPSINEFYALHDLHLIDVAQGTKTLDSGLWHETQKFGTCSYACLQVWIEGHLDPMELKCFRLKKTQWAVDKQKKVLEIREEQMQPWSFSLKYDEFFQETRVYRKVIFGAIEKRKLKTSRLLVFSGEKYLKSLQK